jgi:hypothetical protein
MKKILISLGISFVVLNSSFLGMQIINDNGIFVEKHQQPDNSPKKPTKPKTPKLPKDISHKPHKLSDYSSDTFQIKLLIEEFSDYSDLTRFQELKILHLNLINFKEYKYAQSYHGISTFSYGVGELETKQLKIKKTFLLPEA